MLESFWARWLKGKGKGSVRQYVTETEGERKKKKKMPVTVRMSPLKISSGTDEHAFFFYARGL